MLKAFVSPVVGEPGVIVAVVVAVVMVLRLMLAGRAGMVSSIPAGGVIWRDVRLVVLRDGAERSTELLAVWRDCGRWKRLELASDTVAVADEAERARRLRVLE